MNRGGLSPRSSGGEQGQSSTLPGAMMCLLLYLRYKRHCPPPPVPAAHPHIPSKMLSGQPCLPPPKSLSGVTLADPSTLFLMLMMVRWACSLYILGDNILHKLQFHPLHLLAQGQWGTETLDSQALSKLGAAGMEVMTGMDLRRKKSF